MPRRAEHLDTIPYAPIGLPADEAARYVGMSRQAFEDAVARGEMPRPRMAGSKPLWSRIALEAAFHALPERGARNRLDDLLGAGTRS